MEETILVLLFWAVGVWFAWRQLSNGSGWFGSRFSAATLQSLNAKEGFVKKLLLSLALGYIIFGAMFIKWIFKIALRLTDGFK